MWVTEGYQQMLVLSNLRSPDTKGGGREKPNDWLEPQNGSGAPPSAEVNNKKVSFLSRARGRRTIAILLRVEDKRITETRGTPGSSSQGKKNRTNSISPWKKKDSPVEPRRKIRWVTLGTFLLYTQILYTTLSLSISLSIWRKTKVKKRHLYSWTVQLLYVLTLWKCI